VGTLEEFLPVWQHLVAASPVLRPALLQPITRWLVEAGKKLDPAMVRERRRSLARRVLDGFGDADVYVSPTVAVPPPEIGAWRGLPPEQGFEKAAELGAFTAVFNLSGQPAVSVPAAVSRAGLPIGVQLAGRMYDEGLLLAVARQLEKAMPWSARRSPLCRGENRQDARVAK
jgi:amidase